MRYLFFLMICLAIEATAQTSKGSFMIGGSAGLTRSKTTIYVGTLPEDGPTMSVSLNPVVGYFFVDNLMIGLDPSISHSWSLSGPTNKNTVMGIGPVVRYYFPFGKFAVFPQVAFDYQTNKNTRPTFDSNTGEVVIRTSRANITTYRAGVGLAWFVTPNIGIESILGYSSVDFNTQETSNFDLTFGLQFYLPKKE